MSDVTNKSQPARKRPARSRPTPKGGGSGRGRRPAVRSRRDELLARAQQELQVQVAQKSRVIPLPPTLTVRELAEALEVPAADVLRVLLQNGLPLNINSQLDYETAALVAAELGYETALEAPRTEEEAEEAEDEGTLEPRPPVITVMGHVDHGKTKLLDAIRQTRVAEREAGGITQHIGAYQVVWNGKRLTFLDTPGHEAFTQMRARGAQVTDIAVLVVAADDGVMPQTREAIAHIRAAGVPMVVAINKIDKPEANPERVRQQLSQEGVLVESWGGDVPDVEVSAKARIGIEDLLETLLLVAELEELKANPNRPAQGTIIEARLDPRRGPVATVLIQNGTLRERDWVVVGATYGRVRAMYDDQGHRIRRAGPADPAEILGLKEVPQVGDRLQAVADEETARRKAAEVARLREYEQKKAQARLSLERAMEQLQEAPAEGKVLNLILKADVQGSLEAIEQALQKLSTEDVQVRILHKATGGITESDVVLAAASNALIIGFNSRPDAAARRAAEREGVEIRFYNIIYRLLEDMEKALKGLLEPEEREVTEGYAEVRAVFRLPKRQQAAGLYVLDGVVRRNARARVLRNGVVVFDGTIASLKRFKEDVREVQAGYECGVTLEGFNDFQEGDQIEFYRIEKVAR